MNGAIRVVAASQVLRSGMKPVPPVPQKKYLTPEMIVARLEAAGAALLAMPASGYSTGMRQMKFDIVHSAAEAYGWQAPAAKAARPSAADITLMDEAFGWLALIPEERHLLRRILGARALVHPLTERHLYPWRRLALMLGTDHKTVQRWHGQGVALLAALLR